MAGLSINFINAEYLYNLKAEILKDIVVEKTNNIIPCDDEHNVCFLGEKSANDLISGIQLAENINLTQGTNMNTTEGWLHYIIDGKELYVAKKPFKNNVS